MGKTGRTATVLITAGTMVLALVAPASADGAGAVQVVDGLVGPLQVEVADGTAYISDAFTGEVVSVQLTTGARRTLASGFEFAPGIGVHGGRVLVTASNEPHDDLPAGSASLQQLSKGGQSRVVADLLAHELSANPDGQVLESGDAVSNPYDVLALPGRSLVADAGANAVISVPANGKPRTLTALPNITGDEEGACAEVANNTQPESNSCDAVPTGLALGPDGMLYVSGLGGEVAGRVWKIHPATGEILKTIGGLPPLTGIAVGPDGSIYVSVVFLGTVFKLSPDGEVLGTNADVPAPAGLTFADGAVYAANVGPFAGGPGGVWRIPTGSFAQG